VELSTKKLKISWVFMHGEPSTPEFTRIGPITQLRLMWALISVKPIASMLFIFLHPVEGCFFGKMLNFFAKWQKKKKREKVFVGFLVAKFKNKILIS
jgi:hypothetical protein